MIVRDGMYRMQLTQVLMSRIPTFAAVVVLLVALMSISEPTSIAQTVPAAGLQGRLIVGYQGWFGCPDDFESNKLWQHWFVKNISPETFTIDLLPSLGRVDSADLCDTGLYRLDGSPVRLFSTQNPRVVEIHFRWMRDNGIDGAALQRFLLDLSDPGKKRRSDNVLKNVRKAAETNGRVFFIAYDVAGADPRNVVEAVRSDWRYLIEDLKISESPSYLHDQGKPVLQLWGFGFDDRPGSPDEVAKLILDLKGGRHGLKAATLIGGVPAHWRTLSRDSKSESAWAAVYRSYDVISPWSVGQFSDDAGADAFAHDIVLPDIAEAKRLGIGYMPVIFPGFSWYNLMSNRNRLDQAVLNRISRRCGTFLWRQVSNLLNARVDMMYAAMFDEVDEGTALFPVETRIDRLPVGARMVFLNQDGCTLPDDWYLKITGKAADYLRQKKAPPRRLDAILNP